MRNLCIQIMGWKSFPATALAIDYPPTSAAAAVVGRVAHCGGSLPLSRSAMWRKCRLDVAAGGWEELQLWRSDVQKSWASSKEEDVKEVEIAVDGSCLGNPG